MTGDDRAFKDYGLLLAVLDGFPDVEGVAVLAVDNLVFPFSDFAENILFAPHRLEEVDTQRIFVLVGESERVRVMHDSYIEQIRNFFNEFLQDHQVLDEVQQQISSLMSFPSADLWFRLMLSELFEGSGVQYPRGECWEYGDDLCVAFFYGTTSVDADNRKVVHATIRQWLHMEHPTLQGHQCLTTSFRVRNSISGRRILSMFPDAFQDSWSLWLEGDVVLPLHEDFAEGLMPVTSAHVHKWTAAEVAQILQNPVYAQGRVFEPYYHFLEWQYVFEYCLATLPLKALSFDHLAQVYDAFCDFAGARICHEIRIETRLIEMDQWVRAFQRHLKELVLYLRGQVEAGISQNFMFTIRSRYAYLPAMYQLLSIYFPDEVQERLQSTPFNQVTWNRMLAEASKEQDANRKGHLFEDVAHYFLKTISGLKVTGRRRKTSQEEVDLYCCNVSLDPELWKLGAFLLAECKNRKDKFRVSDLRNLIPTMDAKGIKAALVFSASGFTKAALEEIRRQYKLNRMMLAFDGEDLASLSEQFPPYFLMLKKIQEMENLDSE